MTGNLGVNEYNSPKEQQNQCRDVGMDSERNRNIPAVSVPLSYQRALFALPLTKTKAFHQSKALHAKVMGVLRTVEAEAAR